MRTGVKIMSRMQRGFFWDVTPHILHVVTGDCEKYKKRDNMRIYNTTLWPLSAIWYLLGYPKVLKTNQS